MKSLSLKCLALGLCLTVAAQAKIVNVSDFGACPDDGRDDTEALRRAAAYCREHAGTTLRWAPGRYLLSDADAVDTERRAISGALGRGLEVQWALFNPQRPYATGLDFTGCRNMRIEADGAVLEVAGWMQVISLVKTRNVTIDGLTVTMKRPAATEARVTAVDDSGYDLTFDPQLYQYIDSVVQGRYYFYSQSRKTFYYGHVGETTLMRPGLIRVASDKWHPTVGDVCIIRYGGHYRPCIMVKESRDVTLRGVSILSYPGMGVVGHLSENITVEGLRVVPEPGRYSSTNTDATHFTSCSGRLTLRNCTFKGNGDDCTNVHNYYWYPYPQADRRQVEVKVQGADLHAQSLDYPQRGDTLQAVDRQSMAVKGQYVVKNVETDEKEWRVTVTLDRPMTADAEKMYLVNHTRYPKVFVENNTVYYHNGRAFLLKARDVVVRGNRIGRCTLSAVKLGAELSWHEAGPVEHVVVEDNVIQGAGTDSGYRATGIMVTSESPETPPHVNRNILIRNNHIEGIHSTAILLHDAQDVEIYGNSFVNGHEIIQRNCRNIHLGENRYR